MKSGFESNEHQNGRSPMVSHQSITTPGSVAQNWSGVAEMKREAMGEAYGMAGKDGVDSSRSKAHAQFRDYNWA